MFGMNDENQNTNDDPAMLDNVKDLAGQPASQVEPPQMASSPTVANPATPVQPTGFTMSSPSPATDTSPSPVVPTIPADDTQSTTPAENTAHAEPAPGFSNAADFAAANQSQSTTPADDTPLQDNTIPQPSEPTAMNTPSTTPTEEAPSTEVPEPAPSPQIIGHSSSSMQTSDSPESAEETTAAQPENSVPAPPELATIDVPPAPTADDDASAATEPVGDVDHDQLASLKQEALGHLESLSDHIDGEPEEVFRTTMQMIQANDNHTLLEKALEAAKKIEDDKVRAQAMQDIINEINYFSPQNNSGHQPAS